MCLGPMQGGEPYLNWDQDATMQRAASLLPIGES